MPEQPDFIKDSTEQMVLIPAGEFLMGTADKPHNIWILRFLRSLSEDKDEKPLHKVYLDAYYIDKYEVTNEQYAKFLNKYGKDKDDNGKKMIYAHKWGVIKTRGRWQATTGHKKYPVVCVTWYGANQYSKFYGKRLPTEAEWEKACRAGSNTKYCFGDSESTLGEYCWYMDNSGGKTHAVGTKEPNAWGIYDMHGNVWEWCSDWYDKNYYKNSPADNPPGAETGRAHVMRGSSRWYGFASWCRSANRLKLDPGDKLRTYMSYGFRCVR